MIGVDLVQISDFKKRFLVDGMLERTFTKSELDDNPKTESLAGIFAAKEAFFKALGQKVDWKEVWVEKLASGQPKIYSQHLSNNQKAEVSISHSGDYAIAIVMIF